jgi:hypothetical protein
MKVVNTRYARLLACAAVAAIAACSDSGTTGPIPSPNASEGAIDGKSGDTAVTRNPADTARNGNPSSPVANFTLDVQVRGATGTTTDTTLSIPLAGVRIDLYSQTYVHTGGSGADTVQIEQTLFTSGVTDQTGHVVLPNLPGQLFVIKGTPSDGSGYRSFTGFVPVPYSDKIAMTFVMQKQ